MENDTIVENENSIPNTIVENENSIPKAVNNSNDTIMENTTVKNHNTNVEYRLPKKPKSSFIHFLSDRRSEVKKEFPTLGFGEMQKLLSVQWKQLGLEERKVFEERAGEERKAYEEEKERLMRLGVWEELVGCDRKSTEEGYVGFPLARVKKLMSCDTDVKRVGKEAVVSVGLAGEQFGKYLVQRIIENGLCGNAHTMKLWDVENIVHQDELLDFLRMDFNKPSVYVAKGSGGQKQQKVAQDKDSIKSYFH